MAFDPYESWLGITAAHRPPTYYDLLGLSPFESDPETIERAALRRISKVRQHQIGPHSDASQEVLAELARARLVLNDPNRRADYDAKLRARGESRRDLSAMMVKNVIADVASGVAVPVEDGLGILAKLRTGDESRPDLSIAAGMNLTSDRARGVAAPLYGGLNDLASIADQGSDGLTSLQNTKKKTRGLWKNRFFLGAFLATHVALIGVFFAFGPAIALYVRSCFVRNDPADKAAAQNPKSPDGRQARTGLGPNPIDDNRSAPTTWLKFKQGTRITVANSDDFNLSEHDFTIFARIKTGSSGTVFSKGPAAGGWVPGAKRLFFRNGRLAFEICGGACVETPEQVDDELWHRVAVTYTSQDRQLILFVDRVAHRPKTVAPKRDVKGHVIQIGSPATDVSADELDHFTGLISEVCFYQRALTSAEIDGLPWQEPFGKLPLARWKLREGGGRLFRDQTTHGHDGTLEDGAVSTAVVLAANDEKVAKGSSPFDSKNASPTNGNRLPDGDDRMGREFVGNDVQEEKKADDSPQGILKKHGLKAKGELYVPETEDDVKRKVTDCLHLAGKLRFHLMQKRAAQDAELRPQMIFALEQRIPECQIEIQSTDQEMKSIPKFRGQFYNIEAESLFNQLSAWKGRLEEELRQANSFLNVLRSKGTNLEWTQRNQEYANADLKSYDEALRESRKLVDASKRKIHDLKKNEEVMKALDACRKTAKKPIKLESSPEFAKNVAELEKLERDGWRGGNGGR
jgi:hypothetical protein